ncbi:hypothetical protein RIF29_17897 [Crotalaria pallida]|uniref:Uncharacterized protein n=1 Tax=Crotalaria pallida TaxID=3830 RepID=A0AAN9FL97_CROPI
MWKHAGDGLASYSIRHDMAPLSFLRESKKEIQKEPFRVFQNLETDASLTIYANQRYRLCPTNKKVQSSIPFNQNQLINDISA